MTALAVDGLAARLAEAGFPAAREDAEQLVTAAGGDSALLDEWTTRRLAGEPIEWLVGYVTFLGSRVGMEPGVYVPRPQTEALAQRAIGLLPQNGTAVDLCTGSGAIAVALRAARPTARILATDLDPVACRCARANGVEVYQGHLADPLPAEVTGAVDVVTGVVPYVPTEEIPFLPRDVRAHEPVLALDGGTGGTRLLVEAVYAAARLLRPGGHLVVELGGAQDTRLRSQLTAAGFRGIARLVDDEGDLRGIAATCGRDSGSGR